LTNSSIQGGQECARLRLIGARRDQHFLILPEKRDGSVVAVRSSRRRRGLQGSARRPADHCRLRNQRTITASRQAVLVGPLFLLLAANIFSTLAALFS